LLLHDGRVKEIWRKKKRWENQIADDAGGEFWVPDTGAKLQQRVVIGERQ
jgi:hypothetical protein